MRRFTLLLPFALILGIAALHAEDDGAGSRRADVKPKTEKGDAGGIKRAVLREAIVTKTGKLLERPTLATDSVVAILQAKAQADKDDGPIGFGLKPDAQGETICLYADDDIAQKLRDLAAKGATVQVTGKQQGAAMRVTEVKVIQQKHTDNHKGKDKKRK